MINPTTSSLLRGYTRQSAQTGATRTEPAVLRAPDRRAPAQGAPGQPAETSKTQSADPLSQAISPAEKEMIQERFPESNRMSMRLYGPSRPAGQVAARLGSLLDIKG